MISIVVPTYNEENVIKKFVPCIKKVFCKIKEDYEILFINDGSKDKTWEEIITLSKEDTHIKGICLSRNFGKDSAIMAGLTESLGDCCIVLDCDLQHPPEKILEMYKLWKQGYEIVEARKNTRGNEPYFRKIFTVLFNKAIKLMAKIDIDQASDFKLMDRKVVNVIINMPEKNIFFRALSSWVGFKTTIIHFDVKERIAGKSKWTTFSLIKYAFSNISSFSALPMQIVTILGIITFLISIIIGTISLIQKLCGQALEGFTTIILLQLFSSSIIMISLGIIGYYISKIYEEIKARPRYIISEKCGKLKNTQF